MQLGQKQLNFFAHSANYYDSSKKNSAESATGHVEYSFGNPCLKNLARTRKREFFAQKFPRKKESKSVKTSWFFFVHSANYYHSVKKVPQKVPLDTWNTVLATHAWRIWQGIVNENCVARKFLGKIECSSDKTTWIFSLRVSFNMILWKKSAESASGHVEYTFGNPCLKNWQGLEKNQIDDFLWTRRIQFFRSQCQLIWFCEKNSAAKRLWTRGIQFRQPMLEESGKDYKKNQIFCFESSPEKFPSSDKVMNAVLTKPAEFFRSQCQLIWFCEKIPQKFPLDT